MQRPTQEHLIELLKRWQGLLRLQDWDIDINYDEIRAYHHGSVNWDTVSSRAVISLTDPLKYNKHDAIVDYNIEVSIIHELVHIVLFIIDTSEFSGDSKDMYERGINKIARLLYLLGGEKGSGGDL